MSKASLGDNLIVLYTELSQFLETEVDKNAPNHQLTMRVKALFYIKKQENCTPSFLMKKLNVAKSNLALLCKSLIAENLIRSEKNAEDKRNICYYITQRGEIELTNYTKFVNDNLINRISTKEMKSFEKRLEEMLKSIVK